VILPWFRPTGDGITTYAYDLKSNNELDAEQSGDVTNTYTDSNHLTEIEYSDSTKSTYQYDGNGVRVKKVGSDDITVIAR